MIFFPFPLSRSPLPPNSGPCNSFSCFDHYERVYDDDDDYYETVGRSLRRNVVAGGGQSHGPVATAHARMPPVQCASSSEYSQVLRG